MDTLTGTQTLEGLHDETTQQRVLDRILEFASTPKSNARPEKPPSLSRAKAARADKPPKIQSAPYPGAARTLDRPYQNLSGRRHVPTLVDANRVPFLRIKKPQPPFLSRIIQATVKARNHRILKGEKLAKELSFAQDEEEWDRNLYELADLDSKNLLEPRWQHETKQAVDDNNQRRIGAIQRRADVSAEMYAIIEKEKALAQEEELRIRDEKRKAYKARRLARKRLGDFEIQKGLDSHSEKTVILDTPTMTEDVLNQDQQEVQPPYREDATDDKHTTAKEVLNEGQRELRLPYREEVTLRKPTTTEEVLNQAQQEVRPPYRGDGPLNKVTTTKEVMDQDRQENRSPSTDGEMRKRSVKFKALDKLKQLYKASLQPKTDEEIAKVGDARARRNEGESEMKAQKLERKQEATKRWRPEEAEDLDEALGFLKPPVDSVARRMAIDLQPEVLALPEEPRREWSKPREVDRRGDLKLKEPRREWSEPGEVDRSGDLKLDVLCQSLFQANFRVMERDGHY